MEKISVAVRVRPFNAAEKVRALYRGKGLLEPQQQPDAWLTTNAPGAKLRGGGPRALRKLYRLQRQHGPGTIKGRGVGTDGVGLSHQFGKARPAVSGELNVC
jgi:hypothetical protein